MKERGWTVIQKNGTELQDTSLYYYYSCIIIITLLPPLLLLLLLLLAVEVRNIGRKIRIGMH